MIAKYENHGEIKVLTNMVSNKYEAEKIINGITSVSNKFLNVYVQKFGYVLYHSIVGESVRKKQPFILFAPNNSASLCVKNLAKQLCANENQKNQPAENNNFIAKFLSFLKK